MIPTYDSVFKPWQVKPFSLFSPLKDSTPNQPFEMMQSIAERARNLVFNRTESEIIKAASLINGVIDVYFESLQGQVRRQLLEQYPDPEGILKKEYLERDDVEELNRRFDDIDVLLSGGRIEGLDFQVPRMPIRNAASDARSLKTIGFFLDYQEGSFDRGSVSEYFGVMALLFIEDCLGILSYYHKDSQGENGTLFLGLASNPLAYALEAVSFGEQLKELNKLGLGSKITERSIEEIADKKAKEILSSNSKKGTDERHKKNRFYKLDAICKYEAGKNGFRSVEEAARVLCKEIPVEQRTIVGWIHSYRKELKQKMI